MSVWSLKVGATTRTLAGWGIDFNTMQPQFLSWDADELNFALTKASILEEPPFAYGDAVTLYKDATVWFVGSIVQPSVSASAQSEAQKFTAKNVWDKLENLQWEQEQVTYSAADDFATAIRQATTRTILGARMGVSALEKISTKNQMTDLLDFAIAEGLPLQYDVDFAGLTPPYEPARELTIAAGMRRMGSWTPDLATRAKYNTTPPTIYIRRRAGAATITINLADPAASGLVSWEPMKADYHLVPSGVEISVVSGVTNPADDLRYKLITRFQSANALLPGIDRSRLIRGTITLAGDGTHEEEATPEELAQAYEDALSELFWNTTLTFKHMEVPGTIRPGDLINLTNGQTAWATAKAIVQSVTETPALGLTVVECGRPPMLSQGTLAELQRRISNVGNADGAVSSIFSGWTETPTREIYTGFRTQTLELDGYDNVANPGFHVTATFEIEILSRVSCRVRITAFSGYYLVPGDPFTVFYNVGLYDETGGASGAGALALNVWSVPIATGTLKPGFAFEYTFVRNGLYATPTVLPANLVGEINANA